MADTDKKALIILNPVSGKKRGKALLFDVVNSLSESDFTPTVHITTGKNDAADYVKKHSSDYDKIIAMGGDGTLNEVINGIMNSSNTAQNVGYIPCGTTNDLAKTLGLDGNFTGAIDTAVNGIPFSTDIGEFGDNSFFSYIASFGIFTSSSYDTPQQVKNNFGSLAYIVSGIIEFLNSSNAKSYRLKVKYDGGEIEDEFVFGSVSNSRSIAGIVKLPDEFVNLCDGVFEVFLVRMPKNPIEFNILLNSLTNKKFDSPCIEKFRSSFISIECEDEIPWTVDGEYAGDFGAIDIKNIKGGITIMCPKSRKEQIEKMKSSPALPTIIN